MPATRSPADIRVLLAETNVVDDATIRNIPTAYGAIARINGRRRISKRPLTIKTDGASHADPVVLNHTRTRAALVAATGSANLRAVAWTFTIDLLSAVIVAFGPRIAV